MNIIVWLKPEFYAGTTAAIIRAVEDTNIRQNTASLGEKIRSENGVKTSVEIIERTLMNS
jgi:UDP:flavonoid glycosyltransferase YjiC (YdhE family)